MIFFKLILFFYLFNTSSALALNACNTNDDCRSSWICVNGSAQNGLSASGATLTGICQPNIVLRQVCIVYNVATGVFGKAITLLAIFAFGSKFLLKDLGGTHGTRWTELLALVFGISFVFGAPQIINLISKGSGTFCVF